MSESTSTGYVFSRLAWAGHFPIWPLVSVAACGSGTGTLSQ